MREHPAYTPERVATRRAHEHGRPRAARAPAARGELDVAGHDRDVQRRTRSWDQYDPLPESRRGTFGKTLPGDRAQGRRSRHRSRRCRSASTASSGRAGYSLMQGLQRREREDVFEPDGWYRTGDAGHFDDDGWFYFTGRLGEMIKTPGGANVTPGRGRGRAHGVPRRARGVRHRHPGRGRRPARRRRGRARAATPRSTATSCAPG